MKIGLFGRGRLGRAIADAFAASSGGKTPDGDLRLAWQVGKEEPPADAVDLVFEASAGAAVPQRLRWALEREVPLVIASTGWKINDLEEQVGTRIGVLVAPNLSPTVLFLRRLTALLARFAEGNEASDPYIVEHHHARKLDAPSGTARLLAETMLRHCSRKDQWAIPQPGEPLEPRTLSVSAVRAGTTASSHWVGLDSPGEVLEIRHHSRDLTPYGRGALLAAQWLAKGKRRGVFDMDSVAAELLDPVFDEGDLI